MRPLLAYVTTRLTPCCSCIKIAPNPTGYASAITSVLVSLAKYAKVLAFVSFYFNCSNALFCSLTQLNALLRGSAVVARPGMNRAHKLTGLRKLRTSVALSGSLTFTMHCLHFLLSWTNPSLGQDMTHKSDSGDSEFTFVWVQGKLDLSASFSNTLTSLLSCSSTLLPSTKMSSAMLCAPSHAKHKPFVAK